VQQDFVRLDCGGLYRCSLLTGRYDAATLSAENETLNAFPIIDKYFMSFVEIIDCFFLTQSKTSPILVPLLLKAPQSPVAMQASPVAGQERFPGHFLLTPKASSKGSSNRDA
jgi:hypothetical protein